MKKITLLFLFLSYFSATAQTTKETFESSILGETRELSIYTPPGYNPKDKKEYPLLLVLDGNYLFDPFKGIVSYSSYWQEVPDMIIVGVHFTDFKARERDYEYDELSGLPFEYGLKYYEFLEIELLPHLEKKYKLATLKMIAGHKESAGFINFFLYKENPPFNAFFCFSPEIPEFTEERVPNFLSKTKKRYFYYISYSDSDSKKTRTGAPLLDKKINEAPNPLLTYKFTKFSGTEYSSVVPAIPDAMSSLYASYQPISLQEFRENIVTMDKDFTDYLVEKYKTIYELLGMKLKIRYNDFKAIEVAILKNGAYEEFETLSKLAEQEHPKTMLSSYYMGLYYFNLGEYDKSLKEYQKAFSLEKIGDLNQEMMMDKMDAVKSEMGY
jgi:predicted alpha/beta superfamily hydrolase